jgi:hypothetical protein
MGYLTKMNGKSGQNGFSAVGFSILGQPPRQTKVLIDLRFILKKPVEHKF